MKTAQTNTLVTRDDPAFAGQAVYTGLGLRMYDLSVYKFTMPVLWRCNKKRLVDLYDKNVSADHLDVGVATGVLLDRCRFPDPAPKLTMMDLNPGVLSFAARRLRRYSPTVHQANVLEPWGLPSNNFKSVAMMNLLHCVPGTITDKAVAFRHANSVLAPGGTLFGSTVLGIGVEQNRRSRTALRWFNRRGIFSNLDDSLEDLRGELDAGFADHRIDVQGSMALFVARKAN